MKKLRKMDIQDRRTWAHRYGGDPDWLSLLDGSKTYLQWADTLVENSIGVLGVPLGLATGFIIDDKAYTVPMATEEPSVIAAASFVATAAARSGGFITQATEPLMSFQLFWEDTEGALLEKLESLRSFIEAALTEPLASMAQRGGGFRSLELAPLGETKMVKLQVTVDVRDALGANVLNSCAEHLGYELAPALGQTPLMAIVSNNAEQRRATASCTLPASLVGQLCRNKYPPTECVKRLVLAGALAQHDRDRAVTHNKGIMNGVTALALATGNDTRALEAAVHAWAGRCGTYRGLSQFNESGGCLKATLELPVPLATVGGSIAHHPTAPFSLRLLDQPSASQLGCIAAALGLAQNLAALCALVGTGIQAGHMPLHRKKATIQTGNQPMVTESNTP